jgi:hypothetical protein
VIAMPHARAGWTSIPIAATWMLAAAAPVGARDPATDAPAATAPAVAADTLAARMPHPIATRLRDIRARSRLMVATDAPGRVRGTYSGTTATALQLRIADRDSSVEYAAIRGLWLDRDARGQTRLLATIGGALAGGLYLRAKATENDYDVAGRPIEHNSAKRFVFGAVLGAGAGWAISDLLWHGRSRPRALYP